jgi:hypothetical protein
MTNAIKKHLGDFTAMLVLFAIALFAAGYIIANQTSRGTIPFFEEQPIKIKAEFSDAQAASPACRWAGSWTSSRRTAWPW